MLGYLNNGPRRYDVAPVPVHSRERWEVQAVLSGRCAPLLLDGPQPLAGRSLWVFPPETQHGWTGEPGRPCSIAVFHFDHMPEPLASLVRRRGWLRVDLAEGDVGRLTALHAELAADSPAFVRPLRQDRAALDLALIAAAGLDPAEDAAAGDRGEQLVSRAVAWYDEHMHEGPRLDEMAAAVGASVCHLRRLFHRVAGESPQARLAARRFERACFLLRNTAMSAEEIAVASGFDSGSSFSRAFRRRLGAPPQRWRAGAGGP
jgi:AraC family transcriptional regulator